MTKLYIRAGALVTLIAALAVAAVQPVTASTSNQGSSSGSGNADHGKYLVSIVGCIDCHSQHDPNTGAIIPGTEFSGGNVFDLGPLGKLTSLNITQDKDTGIGSWTDEQIKTAFQTGVNKDGRHLFAVMPYRYFNNMSDQDANDIVAYLRTIKPIKHEVPDNHLLPDDQIPVLTFQTGIVAPDPKDTPARAKYLMTALLTCGDCHTPLDPQTQQPIMDQYLAGGQPFEGPWGIVYGGNITPDKKTGIGSWTDDDIRRLIRTGVLPDGRVSVVMPWQIYNNLTDDDLNAVIYYLRNDVKPVENVVPAPKLAPGVEQHVQIAPPAPAIPPWAPYAAGGVVAVVIVVVAVSVVMRQRSKAS